MEPSPCPPAKNGSALSSNSCEYVYIAEITEYARLKIFKFYAKGKT
ncbi:hypothetical protein CISG_03095 [Coccidioides immitis RMSCC 3703]|uniref:Uncharacterized protein n=1 Tax=Coccidioides immitis RMSCC 3703 TaxID=454286 RepID=A0A0J8QIZ8_COCIT|nr:hypothetical protein CISG_03095 [Coccidioides immitis RMSCC 3703]